jgi:hypothetical protein
MRVFVPALNTSPFSSFCRVAVQALVVSHSSLPQQHLGEGVGSKDVREKLVRARVRSSMVAEACIKLSVAGDSGVEGRDASSAFDIRRRWSLT